jgi:WD40 repeat protein
VPGSETAEGPVFSPDGKWVAFAVGVSALGPLPRELRKYSLETGLTQTIAKVVDYFGGVWLDDGAIVFVNFQPAGLWSVDSGGGEPRQLASKWTLDGKEVARPLAWPSLVPGTRSVILTDWTTSRLGHLVMANTDTGEMASLGIEGSGAQVLPGGYLVYADPNATLMAVRFDAANRRTVGTPVALMPDIAFGRNNVPVFAVSGNGTVAFASGYVRWSRREPMRVARVSPAGVTTPTSFDPDLLYRGFELSRDGNRLAVGVWDGSRAIFDLRRGTRQKMPRVALAAISSLSWHPDGRMLAVSGQLSGSSDWGIIADSLDDGTTETLIREPLKEVFTAGWLPDGSAHIGWTVDPGGRASVFRNDNGQPARPILTEQGSLRNVRISPDGRWLAYDRSDAGPFHVYVAPVTGKGERVPVSPRAGESPRWSHDGRQLFFRSGTAVMAVDVSVKGDQIDIGTERKLFDATMAWEYAVAPNGDFYTLAPVPASFQTHIQLRTRWFEEVDRLMRGLRQP